MFPPILTKVQINLIITVGILVLEIMRFHYHVVRQEISFTFTRGFDGVEQYEVAGSSITS